MVKVENKSMALKSFILYGNNENYNQENDFYVLMLPQWCSGDGVGNTEVGFSISAIASFVSKAVPPIVLACCQCM